MKVAILHEGTEDFKLMKQLANSLGYDFDGMVEPYNYDHENFDELKEKLGWLLTPSTY